MQATDFVESYMNAWNQRDPVAVADHLQANGTYFDIPENTIHSHDELIVSLRDFFVKYRHMRWGLIGDILTGQNTVAFQYQMRPTNNKASGEHIDGTEFITLHGETATTITDYYETLDQTGPAHFVRLTQHQVKTGKYAKSGLNDEHLEMYKKRLKILMNREQLYLRSDLTLRQLAKAVDCSSNHLSQVINAGFGMSFFDFLNRYRIEHARRLLLQCENRAYTILNIAFKVGFNSNSAFYVAFNKLVGQTPAQYRRATEDNKH